MTPEPGWVQQINLSVRSVITVALMATVITGFFLGTISADFLMGLASGAFTWWFARDAQGAAVKESVELLKTPAPLTTTTTTPDTTVVTGPTPPASG